MSIFEFFFFPFQETWRKRKDAFRTWCQQAKRRTQPWLQTESTAQSGRRRTDFKKVQIILLQWFPSDGVIGDSRFFSFVVLGEIEERRQFLADMVSLGQGQKYRNIINTEISQVKTSSVYVRLHRQRCENYYSYYYSDYSNSQKPAIVAESSRTGDAGQKKQFQGRHGLWEETADERSDEELRGDRWEPLRDVQFIHIYWNDRKDESATLQFLPASVFKNLFVERFQIFDVWTRGGMEALVLSCTGTKLTHARTHTQLPC